MSQAFVGLIGVLVGLAINRGYGFWAGRHGELGEAVVGAAVLSEELKALRRRGAGSVDRVSEAWRDYRGSIVIHMSPSDFGHLGWVIEEVVDGSADSAFLEAATAKVDALHLLFWEEREAFILDSLVALRQERHDVKADPPFTRSQSLGIGTGGALVQRCAECMCGAL